ncbi:hypothetical protein [Olavius algarvensis spirochete endosymbiont]|nr:hypothetical protein [Olavius algarvensis spirochete endosymbiont]
MGGISWTEILLKAALWGLVNDEHSLKMEATSSDSRAVEID